MPTVTMHHHTTHLKTMSPLMFIYKASCRLWRMLLRDPFCHVATLVVMRGNGVRHGSFCTNGVPVITVDRKKSRIIIGGNLRMNNGQAGNCIGFSARCSLMALEGGCIYLGDSVGMSQAAICAIGSDITIGNHTLLGGSKDIFFRLPFVELS